MRLGDLSPMEGARRIRTGDLGLRVGPFTLRIRSPLSDVMHAVRRLYADHALTEPGFGDFHVAVARPMGFRRFVRPQVRFLDDGRSPFRPLPRDQAVPLLEWGLNWCIASRAHRYLILHAAVVERGGRAAIFPGDSGAGKSTLCAGLVHSGWRLLSDELALVDFDTGQVHPVARPISLKNESIDVIRRRHPGAVFSDVVRDTSKGAIALVKPPRDSVLRDLEPAEPAWVITPEFLSGSSAVLEPASRATTFMELAHNGFNYSIHGAQGFDALTRMVEACECFHFRYGDLDDACDAFARLADGSG